MPAAVAVPLITAAAGAGSSIIGGALANKSKQTSTPTMDPKYAGLQDLLLQTMQSRLSAPSALPAGYVGAGVRNINASYDAAGKATENALTSRGLAGSPVAAHADLTRTLARAGDVGTFRSNAPLVEREMQNQDLGMANNLLGMGRGVTSTGTAGGGMGGAMDSLAGYLGYLQGKGIFGQLPGAKKPGTPTGGGINAGGWISE